MLKNIIFIFILLWPQIATPYSNNKFIEQTYERDIFWLAWGIFHENRSKSYAVQVKTGRVILKRTVERGLTIEQVIKQYGYKNGKKVYQFTFMRKSTDKLRRHVKQDWVLWLQARQIAKGIYAEGNYSAFQFNHFFVPSQIKVRPTWTYKGKYYAEDDGVVFTVL